MIFGTADNTMQFLFHHSQLSHVEDLKENIMPLMDTLQPGEVKKP